MWNFALRMVSLFLLGTNVTADKRVHISYPSPQCLLDQIQVQKPIEVVATDQMAKTFGKLKIHGKLVVKSKVPTCSGSVALRQSNPIHKRGHKFF